MDRVNALVPGARRIPNDTVVWVTDALEERPAGFRQSDHSSEDVAVSEAMASFFAPVLESTVCALIFSAGNSIAIARNNKSMCK
jgi:hypothetical protein